MKVIKDKEVFTPITMVIESQAELDALVIGMNHNYESFVEGNANMFEDGRFNAANLVRSKMWELFRSVLQGK